MGKTLVNARSRGIFRIYIISPGVRGGTPNSFVKGEDVMIYIDQKNMVDFDDIKLIYVIKVVLDSQ